ncbi:MAG: TolB family protein, partial [Anaerolineales bacterium]
MESPQKLFPILDRFLLGGLGCGVFGICILLGAFVYIWQNPPRPQPNATQTSPGLGGLSTVTPASTSTTSTPGVATPTPTFVLTITPTQQGALPVTPGTVIPSPVPQFDDSPPTGKIVFTCFINQIDQICLMNADGSERKQLTDFEGTAFYASLSPDGKTIYFASRDTGTFEIYSMNLRGRGLRRLTRNIGSLYAPELSPDGERIILANNTEGMQRIWIMRADGNNPHALSTGPEDIDPTWSPDGSLIAFASARTGQRQLY